jgi:Raf kinase inhibitor-like YbhB/YbcL family protein
MGYPSMKANYSRRRHNICLTAILLKTLCLIFVLLAGCESGEPLPEAGEVVLTVSSTAFQDGGSIPDRHTCQGQDVSPPLAWGEPPAGTESIALVMDDLDAPLGVFTHWVIFNIPPDSRELSEAVPAQPQLPGGALQGENSFGRIGYGGPCPPSGNPHRYQFTVYALDTAPGVKAGASKSQLLDAIAGRILARGKLTGTYQR